MASIFSRIPSSLSVAWLFALAVLFVFLLPAVPALQTSIQRNAVVREANRFLADVQFARAQALNRGTTVQLCRSAVTSACRADAQACGCFAGTGRRQFHLGWLIYTTAVTPGPFDPARDTLLGLGEPARAGIVMLGNLVIQDGLTLTRDGAVAERGVPRLSVCAGDESTPDVPGRLVTLNLLGKADIAVIPAGAYCLPPD